MIKEIVYKQIDITNKKQEIENLNNLQKNNFFLLGIEVTDNEIANLMHYSIDPQHSSSKITSLEYVLNYRDDLKNIVNSFDKIFMCTIKPDIDSIGAMALFTLILNEKFEINNDIVLRLKAIAQSDRHGRLNWKEREDFLQFENYNVYGLPTGLFYMTSVRKLRTEIKVQKMIQFLNQGTFNQLEEFNRAVKKNNTNSTKNTDLTIIIPKKLCLVKSSYRGALSYGYKHCPVVIAINDNYIFGKSNPIFGRKITIGQYNDKYIDLVGLCKEFVKLEEGWGGSETVIGSSLTKPSLLTNDKILVSTTKPFLF